MVTLCRLFAEAGKSANGNSANGSRERPARKPTSQGRLLFLGVRFQRQNTRRRESPEVLRIYVAKLIHIATRAFRFGKPEGWGNGELPLIRFMRRGMYGDRNGRRKSPGPSRYPSEPAHGISMPFAADCSDLNQSGGRSSIVRASHSAGGTNHLTIRPRSRTCARRHECAAEIAGTASCLRPAGHVISAI